jgi:hypothetical protein
LKRKINNPVAKLVHSATRIFHGEQQAEGTERGNMARNSGRRRNVTLKRIIIRRRTEITTPPIVCQKQSKGCVFYNGAEVSSGVRVQKVFYGGVGDCKDNTILYKEMMD